MGKVDCEACDNLRRIAPELITEGITNKMCASLGNDTGLNNSLSVLHNDKEDMDDLVDCAVGRMAQEIKMYDVCDWKEYMKRLVPNIHDVMKAINCVDAGQWKNIHNMQSDIDDLWDFAKELCEKIELSIVANLPRYGVFPYDQGSAGGICGTIGEKNGEPLIVVKDQSEIEPVEIDGSWRAAGIGIGYLKKQYKACDGKGCQIYNWLAPWIHDCRISGNVAAGDIIWYCDKASFMAASGFTEYMWNAFTISSWTWRTGEISDQRSPRLEITIDPNRMGEDYITIVYQGTTYPNTGIGSTQSIEKVNWDDARIYREGC